MNDSQSSDAARRNRKRPAARRATLDSSANAQAPVVPADSPAMSEPASLPEPGQGLASARAVPAPSAAPQAKRATARRSVPPPAVSAPVRANAPAPAPATRAAGARAANTVELGATAAVRGEPEAQGLTRAQIAHHVRDATRIAARLAGSDARPPEHGSFLRRLSRFRLLARSEQVDDFGLDPDYEASMRPFFDRMCNDYFRMQVDGMQNIPANGRALLVGNHSGTLPWDGIMLRTALRLHHKSRRELRWLVEDHVFHAPFLGTFVNRIGAVRACQENAERLLEREALLAVFPEGIKGISKRYTERYKLQRFGRGGYVRLALRTGAPVIPVAIVGAEEAYPLLYKVNAFSKSVGFPFIPVTPTFPWLGPLGIAPLPSRWRIAIGPPIKEIARHDASAANDESLVHELNECVRASVRSLLDDALRRRGDNVYVG